MDKPFNIYWFGQDGPAWINSVATFEGARAHIETLPLRESGSYGVFDHRTGNRLYFVPKIATDQALKIKAASARH